MLKYLIKKFMRLFIILIHKDKAIASDTIRSVLVVDSGSHEHLRHVFYKIRDGFPLARISILSFYAKEMFIRENFPDAEIILPQKNNLPGRYKLSSEMLRLRPRNFDCIVLMSLDISTVFTALFLMKRNIRHVFLYNQWREAYLMRLRTFFEFFSCRQGADVKPQNERAGNPEIVWKAAFFIPDLLVNIGAALYLFFSVILIGIKKDARRLFKILR